MNGQKTFLSRECFIFLEALGWADLGSGVLVFIVIYLPLGPRLLPDNLFISPCKLVPPAEILKISDTSVFLTDKVVLIFSWPNLKQKFLKWDFENSLNRLMCT